MSYPSRSRVRSVLRLLLAAAIACGVLTLPTIASAQATRTWISGVGDDVNPCSRTAPCKTLAGAFSKTTAGGEINALDPGGYGGLTITKAITIDLTPQLGGVLVSSTNGITITTATASDDVVLRGINFVGVTGLNGVQINRARSVRIEQSTFVGFGSGSQRAAINVSPTDANTSVVINDVDMRTTISGGIGVLINPTASFTASVTVRNSTMLGFFTTPTGSPETSTGSTGLQVGVGGTAWIINSTIFGNCYGLLTTDPDDATTHGVINAYTNSQVIGNWQNSTATSIIGQPDPQGPAGAAGANGAAGADGVAAPTLVTVPISTRLVARAGAKVAFAYVATTDGVGTLVVKLRNRVIATVRGATKSGLNTLRWNGKAGSKAAVPGTYRLVLTVAGTNGREATSNASLVLR